MGMCSHLHAGHALFPKTGSLHKLFTWKPFLLAVPRELLFSLRISPTSLLCPSLSDEGNHPCHSTGTHHIHDSGYCPPPLWSANSRWDQMASPFLVLITGSCTTHRAGTLWAPSGDAVSDSMISFTIHNNLTKVGLFLSLHFTKEDARAQGR